MPFCPKCGKEVSSEATYCYYCGQSLPKVQPSSEAKPVPTSPVPASPPKSMPEELPLSTSNRNRNILIAILSIVIVVAAVIVAYAFVAGYIGFGVSTAQTGGVGSMAIERCQLNAQTSNYVTVTVKNIGAITLTISTAYIDGAQCSISGNLVFASNQETAVIINAPSGQSFTSGVSHQVQIIASDGTKITAKVTAGMAFLAS